MEVFEEVIFKSHLLLLIDLYYLRQIVPYLVYLIRKVIAHTFLNVKLRHCLYVQSILG